MKRKITPILIMSNRQATVDQLAPSYMGKKQSLLSFTDWCQPLWEETSVSKGQGFQRPVAAAGPTQAAASPGKNIHQSASIIIHAIVPSDLEWFKYSKAAHPFLSEYFDLTGSKQLCMCNNTRRSKGMISRQQKGRWKIAVQWSFIYVAISRGHCINYSPTPDITNISGEETPSLRVWEPSYIKNWCFECLTFPGNKNSVKCALVHGAASQKQKGPTGTWHGFKFNYHFNNALLGNPRSWYFSSPQKK